MTIKLVVKASRHQRELIHETVKLLKKNFKNIKVQWLLANTEYERTLFGVKK